MKKIKEGAELTQPPQGSENATQPFVSDVKALAQAEDDEAARAIRDALAAAIDGGSPDVRQFQAELCESGALRQLYNLAVARRPLAFEALRLLAYRNRIVVQQLANMGAIDLLEQVLVREALSGAARGPLQAAALQLLTSLLAFNLEIHSLVMGTKLVKRLVQLCRPCPGERPRAQAQQLRDDDCSSSGSGLEGSGQGEQDCHQQDTTHAADGFTATKPTAPVSDGGSAPAELADGVCPGTGAAEHPLAPPGPGPGPGTLSPAGSGPLPSPVSVAAHPDAPTILSLEQQSMAACAAVALRNLCHQVANHPGLLAAGAALELAAVMQREPDPYRRINATMAVALLVGHEEQHPLMRMDEGGMREMLMVLACSRAKAMCHGYFWTCWKVCQALARLSANEDNKQALTREGGVDVLADVLLSEEHCRKAITVKYCVEALWNMAFYEPARQQILANQALVDAIRAARRSELDLVREVARGCLFTLGLGAVERRNRDPQEHLGLLADHLQHPHSHHNHNHHNHHQGYGHPHLQQHQQQRLDGAALSLQGGHMESSASVPGAVPIPLPARSACGAATGGGGGVGVCGRDVAVSLASCISMDAGTAGAAAAVAAGLPYPDFQSHVRPLDNAYHHHHHHLEEHPPWRASPSSPHHAHHGSLVADGGTLGPAPAQWQQHPNTHPNTHPHPHPGQDPGPPAAPRAPAFKRSDSARAATSRRRSGSSQQAPPFAAPDSPLQAPAGADGAAPAHAYYPHPHPQPHQLHGGHFQPLGRASATDVGSLQGGSSFEVSGDGPHAGSWQGGGGGGGGVYASSASTSTAAAPGWGHAGPGPGGGAGHVMISYEWGSQQKALMIKEALERRGLLTWMDVEKMSGSTLEAMALAVEGAVAVLLCISKRYKESQACRAEAEYAYQQRKRIIPIMMERGYRPTGWLGILIGTKLYFDFSERRLINERVASLERELGPLARLCRRPASAAAAAAAPGARPQRPASALPATTSHHHGHSQSFQQLPNPHQHPHHYQHPHHNQHHQHFQHHHSHQNLLLSGVRLAQPQRPASATPIIYHNTTTANANGNGNANPPNSANSTHSNHPSGRRLDGSGTAGAWTGAPSRTAAGAPRGADGAAAAVAGHAVEGGEAGAGGCAGFGPLMAANGGLDSGRISGVVGGCGAGGGGGGDEREGGILYRAVRACGSSGGGGHGGGSAGGACSGMVEAGAEADADGPCGAAPNLNPKMVSVLLESPSPARSQTEEPDSQASLYGMAAAWHPGDDASPLALPVLPSLQRLPHHQQQQQQQQYHHGHQDEHLHQRSPQRQQQQRQQQQQHGHTAARAAWAVRASGNAEGAAGTFWGGETSASSQPHVAGGQEAATWGTPPLPPSGGNSSESSRSTTPSLPQPHPQPHPHPARLQHLLGHPHPLPHLHPHPQPHTLSHMHSDWHQQHQQHHLQFQPHQQQQPGAAAPDLSLAGVAADGRERPPVETRTEGIELEATLSAAIDEPGPGQREPTFAMVPVDTEALLAGMEQPREQQPAHLDVQVGARVQQQQHQQQRAGDARRKLSGALAKELGSLSFSEGSTAAPVSYDTLDSVPLSAMMLALAPRGGGGHHAAGEPPSPPLLRHAGTSQSLAMVSENTGSLFGGIAGAPSEADSVPAKSCDEASQSPLLPLSREDSDVRLGYSAGPRAGPAAVAGAVCVGASRATSQGEGQGGLVGVFAGQGQGNGRQRRSSVGGLPPLPPQRTAPAEEAGGPAGGLALCGSEEAEAGHAGGLSAPSGAASGRASLVRSSLRREGEGGGDVGQLEGSMDGDADAASTEGRSSVTRGPGGSTEDLLGLPGGLGAAEEFMRALHRQPGSDGGGRGQDEDEEEVRHGGGERKQDEQDAGSAPRPQKLPPQPQPQQQKQEQEQQRQGQQRDEDQAQQPHQREQREEQRRRHQLPHQHPHGAGDAATQACGPGCDCLHHEGDSKPPRVSAGHAASSPSPAAGAAAAAATGRSGATETERGPAGSDVTDAGASASRSHVPIRPAASAPCNPLVREQPLQPHAPRQDEQQQQAPPCPDAAAGGPGLGPFLPPLRAVTAALVSEAAALCSADGGGAGPRVGVLQRTDTVAAVPIPSSPSTHYRRRRGGEGSAAPGIADAADDGVVGAAFGSPLVSTTRAGPGLAQAQGPPNSRASGGAVLAAAGAGVAASPQTCTLAAARLKAVTWANRRSAADVAAAVSATSGVNSGRASSFGDGGDAGAEPVTPPLAAAAAATSGIDGDADDLVGERLAMLLQGGGRNSRSGHHRPGSREGGSLAGPVEAAGASSRGGGSNSRLGSGAPRQGFRQAGAGAEGCSGVGAGGNSEDGLSVDDLSESDLRLEEALLKGLGARGSSASGPRLVAPRGLERRNSRRSAGAVLSSGGAPDVISAGGGNHYGAWEGRRTADSGWSSGRGMDGNSGGGGRRSAVAVFAPGEGSGGDALGWQSPETGEDGDDTDGRSGLGLSLGLGTMELGQPGGAGDGRGTADSSGVLVTLTEDGMGCVSAAVAHEGLVGAEAEVEVEVEMVVPSSTCELVERWKASQVRDWLVRIGHGGLADRFEEQGITGRALCGLMRVMRGGGGAGVVRDMLRDELGVTGLAAQLELLEELHRLFD